MKIKYLNYFLIASCLGLLIQANCSVLNAKRTTPHFSKPVVTPFGLPSLEMISFPCLVDIDDDGDLDAFISDSSGHVLFYRNTGSASNPSFTKEGGEHPFGILENTTAVVPRPTFVDIDNDGDLDLFLGDVNGDISYFQNTGTAENPTFTFQGFNLFGLLYDLNVHQIATSPFFADMDNDGDYDALIAVWPGNIYYYKNTGDSSSPKFTRMNDYLIEPGGWDCPPYFVDIDTDGDLDCFVGGFASAIVYYENIGNKREPQFGDSQTNPFGIAPPEGEPNPENEACMAAPCFGDLDGDGDMDLLVGYASGRICYFENQPY